jgi:PST family polysaccharide transporter
MSDKNFEPLPREMEHHVKSGILSAGTAQIIKVICQFGSVVTLSRLLPPADFGLVAMTSPLFGFVMLFQDFGLGPATIQKQSLCHDEVNTFFWINVIVGAVLSLSLLLVSPLVGKYYGDGRVVGLTAAMAALIFVSAIGTQHGAILQRRMQFRASAFLDVLATLGSLSVSVACAFLFKGYWAIYFGMAAGTIIPVIGVWCIIKWRPSAPRIAPGTFAMLKFGAGITGSNISYFVARNMDNILIGHRWGDQQLGLYDRAYKLLLFPLQRVVYPVSAVMIPVLSRLINEPDRYKNMYLKTLGQLTFATWPGIIWAATLSDPLIPTLLGKNWSGTIPIFQFLTIAGLMQVFGGLSAPLFISQGRSGDLVRWSVVSGVISLAAFFIGLPGGAVGVAGVYAASECIRAPIGWWYIARKGPIHFFDFVRIFSPLVASAIAAVLALTTVKYCFSNSIYLMLIIGLVASYLSAIFTLCLFPSGRDILLRSFLNLKRIFLYKIVTPVVE